MKDSIKLSTAPIALAIFCLTALPSWAELDQVGSAPPSFNGLEARINRALDGGTISAIQARQFNFELSRIMEANRQYGSAGNAIPRATQIAINADLAALNTEISDAIANNAQNSSVNFKKVFNAGVTSLESQITRTRINGDLAPTESALLETQLHDLVSTGATETISPSQAETLTSRLNMLHNRLDTFSRPSILQLSSGSASNKSIRATSASFASPATRSATRTRRNTVAAKRAGTM